MAEPFLSEIRIFSFNYAPTGWAFCAGQILPINQNQALFALLGTTFGGNGQTNFALPDLRSRVPIHMGGSHSLGQNAGTETVTLAMNQMPPHTHVPNCNNTGSDQLSPKGHFWGKDTAGDQPYAAAPNATMANAASRMATSNVGGSQPHDNMAPSLVLNFCISLTGIFPSRS